MRSTCWKIIGIFSLVLAFSACEKLLPDAPANEEILDGPVDGLSHSEQARFLAGDKAFNDELFHAATGLGPGFVSASCGSCHPGDGKGHPFTTLIRFGQSDTNGNTFLHLGGPQLQNRAIPGYLPEQLPAGATYSRITAPAVTGLGFLLAVADNDILSMADPDDLDNDGISGRVNWITLPSYVLPREQAVTNNGKYIGRLGKKAAVYDLLQQSANAYNQDMGITSTFEPIDPYTGLETDPEVSNAVLNDVVFYLQTLKAPLPRNQNNPEVIRGKSVFISTGCEKCHKQELKTSYSSIGPLSQKIIHPYTDLLLHDMGQDLNDHYTEGTALNEEWRTAPLWGLGLSRNSQGGGYFLLHDGRARSIEEAIRYHGGEAAGSRSSFDQLSPTDQHALIKFLESL